MRQVFSGWRRSMTFERSGGDATGSVVTQDDVTSRPALLRRCFTRWRAAVPSHPMTSEARWRYLIVAFRAWQHRVFEWRKLRSRKELAHVRYVGSLMFFALRRWRALVAWKRFRVSAHQQFLDATPRRRVLNGVRRWRRWASSRRHLKAAAKCVESRGSAARLRHTFRQLQGHCRRQRIQRAAVQWWTQRSMRGCFSAWHGYAVGRRSTR